MSRRKVVKKSLDQFYTKPEIAKKCFNTLKEKVDLEDYDLILEPSAGTGSFFNLLPGDKRLGIDLDPKDEDGEIVEADFLDYVPIQDKSYLVIGNPPFGKVSSIAIKFFNRAASFASVIAFIIPRTFKRVSVQNKLDLNFHLIYNEDLPLSPCCFTPKMSAKCCFQIWERRDQKRKVIKYKTSHPHFQFLKLGPKDDKGQPTPPEGADFALKAYGSNCGGIRDEGLENLRPKSWHFIKSKIDVTILKQRFKALDYSMSQDTVRQDSLGQGELIYLYSQKYK